MVLEETLESPLDCKEIQPVHPKGDQCWVFIERTDVEAETPILWPPDAKSWLIGKDSDAGKDWGQEEKGTTEDEMVRWHHQLSGHGFGWSLGVGDGQGGLAFCGSWGRKESNMTERLNWAFSCVAEFCLLKFCWGFLHLCSSVILACSFLFLCCLWFQYQGDGGLVEWVWKCSFLCNFLEEFQKNKH